ncbi:MAG: recombinase family protein [Methanomicrobiales archaeon]
MNCTKIGYVRVSTTEQNTDNQKNILIKEGVAEDCIFTDNGVSGTVPALKRPGFKKLMNFIEIHPEVKCLCVYELSRLGRTTYETISIIQVLEEKGICVWSLSPNEGFTRSEDKAMRQLMTMILSWVAERERANLVERTKAGLDRAKAEGKKLGRPRNDIDWQKVEAWRKDGLSWVQIAGKLKLSPMQLHRRRRKNGDLN